MSTQHPSPENLLAPPPVMLPSDHPDVACGAALADGVDPREIAAQHPDSSLVWAALADEALAGGDAVAAYAFARTGYHRGLDALRRNGWRGAGPVPWAHTPNRGVLMAIAALVRAAEALGDTGENARCRQLLMDCDPASLAGTGLA